MIKRIKFSLTSFLAINAKQYEKSFQKLVIPLVIVFITIEIISALNTGNSNTNQPFNPKYSESIRNSTTNISQLSPTAFTKPSITATPKLFNKPRLIFGMGSEADGAQNTRLVREAPVRMLTSWYNGPNDLSWMTGWKDAFIPGLYAKGYTLHLITFTEKPEGEVATQFGQACGRQYPVSTQIVDDMKKIASTFSGNGKLYVTLFTEFQTYPCEDNKWVGSENYYNALKSNYRAIKDIFHQYAPNAKVGISWGGWQSRWDDKDGGGGKSLFPHFADIINESDITAFQAMESGNNIEDIRNMTRILGAYGKPVVLSHYKPDNRSQTTFDNDMNTVLTDSFLTDVTSNGLIAMSFMDSQNMDQEENIYQFIKSAVIKYSKQ